MDRETELSLLDELKGLSDAGSAYLDEDITRSAVEDYTSQSRFNLEKHHIFSALPHITCHSSELAEPGAFLRAELAGKPILLTRDRNGEAHAFLNVCRHRGARLVEDQRGCRHLFSCPYHAWTWSNTGMLRGIPHQKQGFPDIDKSQYGLIRLPCAERLGWVWVVPDPNARVDIDAHLAPIAADIDWLETDSLQIAQESKLTCTANWKLLVEGGIEAYHFSVAHAKTIGPYFPDNLSSYQCFGPHMRSVLPRVTLTDLKAEDRENWSLRTEANMVYSIFPTTQWLVQQDHIVWIHMDPIGPGETRLRLATLAPVTEIERIDHWQRNHAITMTTLTEDFEIGEAIQSGLESGANTHLTFGRYEGALHRFARTVQAALDNDHA